MKTQHNLILLFSAFLFLNLKCKKENEPQLPPETTTGAMTFGCKIDGKVFVPEGGNGFPGIVTEYPFLGNGPGGGWFLNIAATDEQSNLIPGVSITTDSLLLIEGVTYQLKNLKGFAKGEYFIGLYEYRITASDNGTLVITKHDQAKRILSGRFSFSATNVYDQTKKAYITEGRFDIRY